MLYSLKGVKVIKLRIVDFEITMPDDTEKLKEQISTLKERIENIKKEIKRLKEEIEASNKMLEVSKEKAQKIEMDKAYMEEMLSINKRALKCSEDEYNRRVSLFVDSIKWS